MEGEREIGLFQKWRIIASAEGHFIQSDCADSLLGAIVLFFLISASSLMKETQTACQKKGTYSNSRITAWNINS